MSRVSIDELGVSSVSTVTTPSQSIIDLESNKANMSTTHNTSTTHLSINTRTNQKIDVSSNAQNGLPNFSFLTVSSDNRTIVASEIDSNSEQYPDILAKYAKIADQCSQRISNLSAMIEKVREEKNKMLQTPSLLVTNDSSTRYMDLPSPKKYIDEKDSAQYKSASSSSSEEGRNLLEIDLSLAEKLKGLTPEEIRRYENTGFLESSLTDCKAEEDLAKRLRALKEPVLKDQISSKDQHVSQEQLLKYSGNGDSVDFIPFLLNIPKMPPLTVEPTSGKHKKPPPSKGLLVTRKITEDFATVPHELSTIPEQDSQTRFENTLKEKSPITPKDRRNSSVKESIPEPKKALVLETKKIPTLSEKLREETLENVITQVNDKLRSCETHSEQESSSLQTETKRLTSNQNRTSVKVRELLNLSDNSLGSSNTSGDEKIEMFRIEAMLRSIGMDWAISTLRKTQEALALTSSSSSLDIKSSAAIKELSESDIKEYLTKQIFQKISSSTLRSDASPGSLNESHELSGIQNADFANKQTSTPVNRSRELLKSDEKSSDSPSAIALEKESKDFFSLPEHSP
ncbi:hypothetical protein HHI36_005112 [Cryptolaemus montrouzieri]|uniref:Uncharacterized protein n=1 Tax=Cryptolaemus montrouzieri TaxID=559131 RepID=A0ABD2NU29_9CUCU